MNGLLIGFISGEIYIGFGCALVIATFLYIIGFIKTSQDEFFFDVIIVRFLHIPDGGRYEP